MQGHRSLRQRRFDVWPGFVDALASVLLITIFVLLVLVIGQQALSVTLSGKDEALRSLESQISELNQSLRIAKMQETQLQQQVVVSTMHLSQALEEKAQILKELESAGISTEKAQERARKAMAREQSAKAQSDLLASLRKDTEEQQRAISEKSRVRVEALQQQIAALRGQLERMETLLSASEEKAEKSRAQITNLSKRLNEALAGKVQELRHYRSEFFGRLREILGNRKDVRIVGDRFVLQSELLFATGSAELGEAGKEELLKIAQTLQQIAQEIPKTLDWVLRVDGHTDSRPMRSPIYASNWELSSARALAVVHFLIAQGLPPHRLAAAGFGLYHPLEKGDGPEVWARNRRIEFKLTQR